MTFYKAPTSNFISTTLNGSINDAVTTITLTSTSGLQSPGVIIINREDGSGTATPNKREVVSYAGISGSDLTGCTRGAENSSNREHDDGSLVEAFFSIGQWNDLRDATATALSTDGTNLAVSGTASIATLKLDNFLDHPRLAVTSVASVSRLEVGVLENTQQAVTSVASIAQVRYQVGKPAAKTDADGATVTMDFDVSPSHTVVLGGNRIIAFSNFDVGQSGLVRLTQDGSGSRTVTWTPAASPVTIYWSGGTPPTLTTTANKTDSFGFYKSSASTYDGYIVGQNI